MPLATLAAQISPAGISAPAYDAILLSLQDTFKSIYGSDIYIAADSQDGQLLAIIAKAIDDANKMAIAVYNSFSPSYAQDEALSARVAINGLRRAVPTFSTADGTVVGVTGTLIQNGSVRDDNGNLWSLPPTVLIPLGGAINVTVLCQNVGAVAAATGTINEIATPTLGWQSFVSISDAVPGQPLESDAALRRRRAASVSMPAVSPLGAMLGALADLEGVVRVKLYENVTGGADANGLAAHSIAVVIEGGDLTEIATVIGQKKTPGAALNGTTVQAYVDPITGINYNISFYVLTYTAIAVDISLDALDGWSSTIEAEVQQAIADHINALAIGKDVEYSRLWAPAYLSGKLPDSEQYHITSLDLNGGAADIVVPFNKSAKMLPADVTITVNP